MSTQSMRYLRNCCSVLFLLWATLPRHALAQGCTVCGNGQEQKVKFNLRGTASMAGSATATVSYGDTTVVIPMVNSSGNTTIGQVVPDGTGHYIVPQGGYACAQWQVELSVEPKVDQPVLIEYNFDSDNTHPTYTEFEYVGGPNPVTYYSRASSRCLKVYFDLDDEAWFPEQPVLYYSGDVVRLKGVLGGDDSNLGDCLEGPTAGGGFP